MRDRILLAHGGGGELQDELIEELILPRLGNEWLAGLPDAAELVTGVEGIAFTTDSYVVQPLFFPGGDIGRLAVSGTVNDLAVAGADPAWISLALILEEGLETAVLARVLDSVAATAEEARVRVVTGDTKVVGRGQADGLYVNTSGLGPLRADRPAGPAAIRPGDVLIVSGTIGDHGMAVMLARADLASRVESDAAPLGSLVRPLLSAAAVRFLRDPTRGGLAAVAADLARVTGLGLTLFEDAVPVRAATRSAAELLGLDLLAAANEGKVVAVVAQKDEAAALAALRAHPLGRRAAAIGRFGEERDGTVELVTTAGGRRVVSKPYGEELPRIC